MLCSHQIPMGSITGSAPDLLRGTVDLLILRTLANGPLHGYAIAQRLRIVSEEVLQVGESSLYPSLQRLLLKGWVSAEWGASENNRRARYYQLTAAGKRRLQAEVDRWKQMSAVIAGILQTTPEEL